MRWLLPTLKPDMESVSIFCSPAAEAVQVAPCAWCLWLAGHSSMHSSGTGNIHLSCVMGKLRTFLSSWAWQAS